MLSAKKRVPAEPAQVVRDSQILGTVKATRLMGLRVSNTRIGDRSCIYVLVPSQQRLPLS
jgi:hypothetical protein